MTLTDTHCHLNHPDFQGDWQEALERARESCVRRLLVVGFDLPSSRRAVELAVSEPDIQAVIGIHPESAAQWSDDTRAELIALSVSAGANLAAWGEIGLDYYWDSVPRDVQLNVFRYQIDIAASLNLPLVIHCRDAYPDVLDTLAVHGAKRVVLHCFVGTADDAARAIEAGYYLGVGGIATYKKSGELRDTLASVPIDRLLLETDAPYLAPQARRGKRNEPAYVSLTAEALAPLLGLTANELAAVTTDNANRLFGPLPVS